MTCAKCEGRGYTIEESGKLRICTCVLRERHKAYLEPMKAFLSPHAKSATPLSCGTGLRRS